MIPNEVFWLTCTVYQEAQGEPKEGKLAVAYVIMNRCWTRNLRVPEVVFAPKQFSCWNEDSSTRLRLTSIVGYAWWESAEVSDQAFNKTALDPSLGATHYLNEKVTKQMRGVLPSWFKEEKVTVRIGNHTFLLLN